jgi:hypothetical protein
MFLHQHKHTAASTRQTMWLLLVMHMNTANMPRVMTSTALTAVHTHRDLREHWQSTVMAALQNTSPVHMHADMPHQQRHSLQPQSDLLRQSQSRLSDVITQLWPHLSILLLIICILLPSPLCHIMLICPLPI